MHTAYQFDKTDSRIVYVKAVDVADLPEEVQAGAAGQKQLYAVHDLRESSWPWSVTGAWHLCWRASMTTHRCQCTDNCALTVQTGHPGGCPFLFFSVCQTKGAPRGRRRLVVECLSRNAVPPLQTG